MVIMPTCLLVSTGYYDHCHCATATTLMKTEMLGHKIVLQATHQRLNVHDIHIFLIDIVGSEVVDLVH